MTVDLTAAGVDVVLLDIEGTTSPVSFVYDVLFPYARARIPAYLEREAGRPACQEAVAWLWEERADDVAAGDAPPSSLLAYVDWLMHRDRKSRGLKALQGLVWEEGYARGDLQGAVYPDVPPVLARWHARAIRVCIYSSGSVLAQRLIFRTTLQGDLTRFLSAYFDTAVGPKASPESYRAILAQLQMREPAKVLFVSDVVAELEGARAAGLRTALCVRGREPDQQGIEPRHSVIRTFDDLVL